MYGDLVIDKPSYKRLELRQSGKTTIQLYLSNDDQEILLGQFSGTYGKLRFTILNHKELELTQEVEA